MAPQFKSVFKRCLNQSRIRDSKGDSVGKLNRAVPNLSYSRSEDRICFWWTNGTKKKMIRALGHLCAHIG